MKKMWKRFWTLTKRQNGGFTLVELIVVIAILAILAGVGVPVYSGYVTKANKQADISLASEIEQALMLAHYSNKLIPGATVVVQRGEAGDTNVVVVEGEGAEDALTATFGASYTDLRLKYDGWDEEIGVAGDADTVALIRDSNFNPEAMDSLLSQLQLVVDAAEGHFADKAESGILKANEEIASILSSNGIEVTAGESLSADKATAVANAYVYMVAGKLSELDISPSALDSGMDEMSTEFLEHWTNSTTNGIPTDNSFMDGTSCSAAEYARVYALATYIDREAGLTGENSYTEKLDNSTDDPRDVAKTVWNEIKSATEGSAVKNAYNAYYGNGGLTAYTDAVSFLAYMQGVDNSADSLMKNTDLNSANYYNDGYVAEYVNNYIDLSDVLTSSGVSSSAFAFIYTGDDVLCMPLDW